jgi:hypothetical protein
MPLFPGSRARKQQELSTDEGHTVPRRRATVEHGRMSRARPCLLPSEPATRQLLAAAGLSAQMIRTQLAAGRLVRVRQGVFLDHGRWPADAAAQHLVRAHAEQVVHPDAVLSHESAAVVWALPHPGFDDWAAAAPSVTLPATGRARSRRGPAVHHVGALPTGQVTRDPAGYAVTSVARTAVDLAVGLPSPEALVVLDAAARLLVSGMVVQVRRSDFANRRLVRAAHELLIEAARARRPAGLLPVIDLCDPARESPAESLSAGHFTLAGLPAPVCQAPVPTPLGTLYPDFLWREYGLIGECDGAVKYADGEAYVREKQREQVLRDLGYRMVRWLAREIMTDPALVVGRVARMIAA